MINRALEGFLPPPEAYPPVIHEAMRYSVFAGGKRLRPILHLATTDLFTDDPASSLFFACSLELVHTYSLIHDDLPSMDDDDFRRGRPTSHKVFGEAVAVLAGDALLTLAFEIIAREGRASAFPPDKVLAAAAELARAAGSAGMIGGQVADISSLPGSWDEVTLAYIHSHKTGALIRASVCSAAILHGASASQLERLASFASSLGLCFQIVDDILDITGDEARMGKRPGSDERNARATYPGLHGLTKSQELAKILYKKAVRELAPFGDRAGTLRALAAYLVDRES
ncbi:MAG: polyprenyl synthetase family protein [Firmicutes bacterium]|nr:polyprenyl synthetase family protein [Bacillota bacterium]